MEFEMDYDTSCYALVKDLNDSMNRLNNDIGSIQTSNVINNSKLDKIDNSIKDINKDIKKINSINHKRVCIRNLKVFKNILKIIIHPLIALCIALSVSHFMFNDIPFIRQDRVNTMRYETTIDNQGNITTNNKYSDTNWFSTSARDKSVWIYKYDQWRKDGNGYIRSIDGFVIDDSSIEKIEELFNDPDKLEKLYANSRVGLYETKDEITEEELQEENYMKAVIHYEDKNDYYIAPQSEEENSRDTAIFLATLFGSGIVATANTLDYIDKKRRRGQGIISEEYEKLDIEDIKKQFSEKRIEFEKKSKQLKKELSN